MASVQCSRKQFSEKEAERWWEKNQVTVYQKYGIEGYIKTSLNWEKGQCFTWFLSISSSNLSLQLEVLAERFTARRTQRSLLCIQICFVHMKPAKTRKSRHRKKVIDNFSLLKATTISTGEQ
ncbi:hypothetical protein K1719_000956 [Acacia pycnantha]|nr:hypothetical protein K1719_000956 [Acacia pycnantha]